MTIDLRTKAEWLNRVAGRVASPEVAKLLSSYANEMLSEAEITERRRHAESYRKGKNYIRNGTWAAHS